MDSGRRQSWLRGKYGSRSTAGRAATSFRLLLELILIGGQEEEPVLTGFNFAVDYLGCPSIIVFFLGEDGGDHESVIPVVYAFCVVKPGVVDFHWFLLCSAALTCTHLYIIISIPMPPLKKHDGSLIHNI